MNLFSANGDVNAEASGRFEDSRTSFSRPAGRRACRFWSPALQHKPDRPPFAVAQD